MRKAPHPLPRGVVANPLVGASPDEAGLVGDDNQLGAVAGLQLGEQRLTWVFAVA